MTCRKQFVPSGRMTLLSVLCVSMSIMLTAAFSFTGYALKQPKQQQSAASTKQTQPAGDKKSVIVLLGTGTPNAEPDRSGPSIAIIVNDTPYLFDCGPGVVRRAAAAAEKGITALRPENLVFLFITHLHSDHTLGYPDLLLTPWVIGRTVPMEVFGPPGIIEMTDYITEAYSEDIDIRLYGLEPANKVGYKANIVEVFPGTVYSDSNITVKAFFANHGNWQYAYGYRVECPDRVIVISGDTAPGGDLEQYAQGCDVLIHEVYSEAGFQKLSPDWQRYHGSSHTSTYQLGDLANKIKPKLLILYHQLTWGSTPEEILAEIGEYYKGKVAYGNDLEVW